MRIVKVVTPAEPIVAPTDISGSNPLTELAIAAVTDELAAPEGWLGRSLGRQTLELTDSCWPCELPFGPVIGVTEIEYTDSDGVTHPLNEVEYKLVGDTIEPIDSWPAANSVRIRYAAGYDEVPANAKYAVILATRSLLAGASEDAFVTSETVEGVGSVRRQLGQAASVAVNDSIKRLLAPLRVFT